MVDVQVDFTGLAIYARIARHKIGYPIGQQTREAVQEAAGIRDQSEVLTAT